MRILLITYYFPPYNVIGAVRTGKLAEYWVSQGYEVRVISASKQPLSATLPTNFPKDSVHYTDWINVNALPEKVLGGRSKIEKKGFSSSSSLLSRLGGLYKTLFNFPDGQIGWYPFAINEGKKIIKSGWKPDLIYASAHPATSLLVARKLSVKFDIPWVAEFRDLWTDNHNYKFPKWRKWLEAKLETKVLSNVSAAVTISEPLAKTLSAKTKAPVATILNGFDPKDYSESSKTLFTADELNIVYTGMVYTGKQDVTALFQALKQVKNKDKVKVHFYGRYLSDVEFLAEQYDVKSMVLISHSVPYAQAIKIQMHADILLFLLWCDQSQSGVYTGKLFEYFGARHPILAIGLENGVAADLIRERKAGFISNDASEIAKQLDLWIEQKLKGESDFKLPASASAGLTRNEQFSKLDCFLTENNLLA